MPVKPEEIKAEPPRLHTPEGTTPLAKLKQQTERADRIADSLNRRYPNGLGEVMEHLKIEQN